MGNVHTRAPYNSAEHMYQTIDSVPYGDIVWMTFKLKYNNHIMPHTPAWKLKTYTIHTCDALCVVESIVSSVDFDGRWDYVLYKKFSGPGCHLFTDVMSGTWAFKKTSLYNQLRSMSDPHGKIIETPICWMLLLLTSTSTPRTQWARLQQQIVVMCFTLAQSVLHLNTQLAHRTTGMHSDRMVLDGPIEFHDMDSELTALQELSVSSELRWLHFQEASVELYHKVKLVFEGLQQHNQDYDHLETEFHCDEQNDKCDVQTLGNKLQGIKDDLFCPVCLCEIVTHLYVQYFMVEWLL
ncbi:hypothetical protein L226DRAFT_527355 [Lentinus tigrinus ALCF2SS1-7]|uniref:uncharacterized protein n=1 Tax=Lentinus tigrinus ALCF2SS1-7 TaxID=1328758 RepID=UPI0011660A4C|nr:hypothetical protein L226DRAFT_527355 [Lentinus tigrinus ALCF2SS1-7]